jgi:hypothetical protein
MTKEIGMMEPARGESHCNAAKPKEKCAHLMPIHPLKGTGSISSRDSSTGVEEWQSLRA